MKSMSLFDQNMPIPRVTPDTHAFWEGCRQHRLLVQRCTGCSDFRFAPGPICPRCHSREHVNVETKGLGEVFTWTVTYRPVHPATRKALPFNVVVVRLDDCGRVFIVSNLLGVSNDEIYAGMPVELSWERISDVITLPRFLARKGIERDNPLSIHSSSPTFPP